MMELYKAKLPLFLPKLKPKRQLFNKDSTTVYKFESPTTLKLTKPSRVRLNMTLSCKSIDSSSFLVDKASSNLEGDFAKLNDSSHSSSRRNICCEKLPPLHQKPLDKKKSPPFERHRKQARSFTQLFSSPLSGWSTVESLV